MKIQSSFIFALLFFLCFRSAGEEYRIILPSEVKYLTYGDFCEVLRFYFLQGGYYVVVKNGNKILDIGLNTVDRNPDYAHKVYCIPPTKKELEEITAHFKKHTGNPCLLNDEKAKFPIWLYEFNDKSKTDEELNHFKKKITSRGNRIALMLIAKKDTPFSDILKYIESANNVVKVDGIFFSTIIDLNHYQTPKIPKLDIELLE